MRKVFTFVAIILVSSALCNFVFLEDNLQQTQKCAAFTCNTSNSADGKCYTGTGSVIEGNRKTTLYTCKEKQQCSVVDLFNYALDVSCTDEVPPVVTKNYLPGEACEADGDCKMVTLVKDDSDTETTLVNKCVEKKCQGNEPTKKCVNHQSCTVGHWCADFDDKKRGTCKPYAKEGEACVDVNGCPFGLTCTKNKCTKVTRTVALGTEVAVEDIATCLSGFAAMDKDNKLRCANRVYDSTKHTTLVNNEAVECSPSSDCYYANRFSDATDKDEPVKETEKCVCSFSGKGYCPFAQFSIANRITKVNGLASKVAANEKMHHTEHRGNEYINTPSDLQYATSCRSYYMSPHSYGSSSACATASQAYKYCTYMSSSFIKFSFVLLGLILALL